MLLEVNLASCARSAFGGNMLGGCTDARRLVTEEMTLKAPETPTASGRTEREDSLLLSSTFPHRDESSLDQCIH